MILRLADTQRPPGGQPAKEPQRTSTSTAQSMASPAATSKTCTRRSASPDRASPAPFALEHYLLALKMGLQADLGFGTPHALSDTAGSCTRAQRVTPRHGRLPGTRTAGLTGPARCRRDWPSSLLHSAQTWRSGTLRKADRMNDHSSSRAETTRPGTTSHGETGGGASSFRRPRQQNSEKPQDPTTSATRSSRFFSRRERPWSRSRVKRDTLQR